MVVIINEISANKLQNQTNFKTLKQTKEKILNGLTQKVINNIQKDKTQTFNFAASVSLWS